jgi:dipeptidyl aminopeptidase/acylaminoacyl peptidase
MVIARAPRVLFLALRALRGDRSSQPRSSWPFVFFVVMTLPLVGAQQRPPANTEVYLTHLERDVMPLTGDAALNISNNPGYDNEPSFTPDGKSVLFVSNRDGKQTDIYRYDISTKALTQLTHTPESEYSPLVTPDGKTFSVIRVEADGTQRLWRFDLDGSNPRRILENVKGVGYQAWLDPTHVAVFIVGSNGQPNTLQLADTTKDAAEMIDSNPGHGLALRPGPRSSGVPMSSTAPPTLTYVCKTDPAHWVVKEFNLTTHTTTVIQDALQGSEDLAWDPVYGSTRLLMAKGPMMYASFSGAEWRLVGDFTAAGVDRITRLAVNPDRQLGSQNRLVFVAEPVSK